MLEDFPGWENVTAEICRTYINKKVAEDKVEKAKNKDSRREKKMNDVNSKLEETLFKELDTDSATYIPTAEEAIMAEMLGIKPLRTMGDLNRLRQARLKVSDLQYNKSLENYNKGMAQPFWDLRGEVFLYEDELTTGIQHSQVPIPKAKVTSIGWEIDGQPVADMDVDQRYKRAMYGSPDSPLIYGRVSSGRSPRSQGRPQTPSPASSQGYSSSDGNWQHVGTPSSWPTPPPLPVQGTKTMLSAPHPKAPPQLPKDESPTKKESQTEIPIVKAVMVDVPKETPSEEHKTRIVVPGAS